MRLLRSICLNILLLAGFVAASTLAAEDPGASAPTVRVALYQGPGTGGQGPTNLMKRLEHPPGFSIRAITPAQLRHEALTNFDVVIFAGGSARKQAEALDAAGLAAVRRFVEQGGGYVGICAGAYLATCGSPQTRLNLINATTRSPQWKRGKGQVEMEWTEAGKGILGGPGGRTGVRYANGPVVQPAGRTELAPYETLALFRTELAENHTPAGLMVNSPAIWAAPFGQGRVVCISPHPEQTSGLDHVVPALAAWTTSSPRRKTSPPR